MKFRDKINLLQKNLNLKEIELISFDEANGVSISVVSDNHEKLLLKVCLVGDKLNYHRYKNEAIKTLALTQEQTRDDVNYFSQLSRFNQTDDLFWLCRKFYHGDVLCSETKGIDGKFALDRYYVLSDKYISQPKKIILKLRESLDYLWGLSPAIIPGGEKIRFDLTEVDQFKLEKYVDFQLGEQLKLAKEFDGKNIAISVSDLVPPNIIISENDIIISDLEWLCQDNKFIDVAYFWLFLNRYPNWQKELINEFVQPENRIEFISALTRILLWWFDFVRRKFSESQQKLLLDSIWLEYLKDPKKVI